MDSHPKRKRRHWTWTTPARFEILSCSRPTTISNQTKLQLDEMRGAISNCGWWRLSPYLQHYLHPAAWLAARSVWVRLLLKRRLTELSILWSGFAHRSSKSLLHNLVQPWSEGRQYLPRIHPVPTHCRIILSFLYMSTVAFLHLCSFSQANRMLRGFPRHCKDDI
jgi:hypothetical protein